MDPAEETQSTGVRELRLLPDFQREEPLVGAPIERDPPDVEIAEGEPAQNQGFGSDLEAHSPYPSLHSPHQLSCIGRACRPQSYSPRGTTLTPTPSDFQASCSAVVFPLTNTLWPGATRLHCLSLLNSSR